jgi:hypothetical protein
MEVAGLASLGAKLGFKGAKSAWDITRINIDMTIDNQHPGMRLEYATRFIIGGGCIDAPASEIGYKASPTIQLEADAAKVQFEGVLLYKLIPEEPVKPISSSKYLVLGWKVHVYNGLYSHMTLIEHDDDSVSLGGVAAEKYYSEIFCDKHRKLKEAIRCSWSLGEDTPFTVSMTASDKKSGKISVEIREGKSEANELEPIPIELDE